jgi:O-antigen/teichoic acid export membrane protein
MILQKSYTKNYFKIYAAQLFAVVFNVLSLIIVIPFLSNNSRVYGIYSLCVSFTIFLSYADLGFLNAGYKYAAEYYAKNNRQKEIEITGFVSFILTGFILIFAIVLMLFAFHPYWLIKNISDTKDIYIAKNLLLILALFSPNMIFQRTLQIIYGVRVHDYIFQTILIVINGLKIASVYFFVTNKDYNIIGYFLFCQTVTSVGLIAGILYASKKFSISLKALVTHIKFSKEVFQSIKKLAFSSLYVTIAWILFYEFDPYAIAKLAGADAVAYYSIGLTCLAFFRSIFGTLFGPFNARFNHFVAIDDLNGLTNFSKTVMCILLPAVVFPTLSLAILSKPIVFTWVGDKFNQSAGIVTFLSLCNILGFITYPSGILSMATKKIKFLYIISTVQLIIYWSGIALFFSHYGYIVFAWFELICFSITGVLYTIFMCRFLHMSIFRFIRITIVPAILPVIALFLILFWIRDFLPLEKNKLNLFEVVLTGAGAALIATFLYYFTSKPFKNYIDKLLVKFKQARVKVSAKKHIHFI